MFIYFLNIDNKTCLKISFKKYENKILAQFEFKENL